MSKPLCESVVLDEYQPQPSNYYDLVQVSRVTGDRFVYAKFTNRKSTGQGPVVALGPDETGALAETLLRFVDQNTAAVIHAKLGRLLYSRCVECGGQVEPVHPQASLGEDLLCAKCREVVK